jgi:hypothetical protein
MWMWRLRQGSEQIPWRWEEKGLVWVAHERVPYVVGVLGNRRGPHGDGSDLVVLCRMLVFHREGVVS